MAAACLLAVSANSQAAGPKGGNPNPGIAPPQSQVLGEGYDEWAIMAAQWANSFPLGAAVSPALTVGTMVIAPQLTFQGEMSVPVTMKVGQ